MEFVHVLIIISVIHMLDVDQNVLWILNVIQQKLALITDVLIHALALVVFKPFAMFQIIYQAVHVQKVILAIHSLLVDLFKKHQLIYVIHHHVDQIQFVVFQMEPLYALASPIW